MKEKRTIEVLTSPYIIVVLFSRLATNVLDKGKTNLAAISNDVSSTVYIHETFHYSDQKSCIGDTAFYDTATINGSLSFGFGVKWRSWIKGSLISGMASVLVNASPTSEFQFHCGLKQGDPLAPYLFILVMESLHLSVSRTVEARIFTGIKIDFALSISHLFYADDAVFIGEWTDSKLRSIIQMLHCFSLASGLKINLQKSNLLGVGVTGSS
ncbi:RNA-directed DNA polymerase, eukaryota [Tanacetum coccineum]